MTRPLSGAAASAHARRILIDEARDLMAQRPHVSSVYIVGLLVAADAKTPRRIVETAPADCGHPNHGNPDHRCEPFAPLGTDELVVTRYTRHGLGHQWTRPDIRMTPLTTPSRVPTPGPQVTTAHEHGHRVPRMGRGL